MPALLDLVLPVRCLGCGTAGAALCAGCARASPLRLTAAGLPVAAGADYAGAVRAALLAYKERGRRDLAAPLAAILAAAVRALGTPAGVLVPVPSTRASVRVRGGDHVRRLARRVAGPVGARVEDALVLARQVGDQSALTASGRAANVSGAMRAHGPPRPGSAAVVVDDIVTTGATLGEAARALAAAGWTVTGAAVVAATARRWPAGQSAPGPTPSSSVR